MFKKRDNLEYEFLPSALEITETPHSPLGSFTIWTIFLLFLSAILWSCIGKVDEVATARGKVIPDGRLKVIQPLEEGIVKAIYVEEGQTVKQGDLIIELDSTFKKADVEGLEKSYQISILEKEILNSELEEKEVEAEKLLKKYNMLTIKDIESQMKLKRAREIEYKGNKERIELIIMQKKSELEITKSNYKKIENRYYELQKEEEDLRYLYNIGSIAKRKWLDKKSEYFSTEQELEAQKSAIKNIEDKISEEEKNLENISKERKTKVLTQMSEIDKKVSSLETELTKADRMYKLQKLVSPVDGKINGLATFTIGGVLTPAQPVVTIVPDDTPMMVEASVLNRDIGFINIGQETEIKLDTFPFQKYGTINGTIIKISPDAFEDEKMGLIYKVLVKPEKEYIVINGNKVNLSSGMSLTLEIKTGKRRIIEFFLSPLVKYAGESLKLR